MSFIDGETEQHELAFFILATVEGKAIKRRNNDGTPVVLSGQEVFRHMNLALPQVIMQVQLALQQHLEQQQIAAIQFLNDWCRILFFKRECVPLINVANLHKDGYWPAGSSVHSSYEERRSAYETMLGYAYFASLVTPIFDTHPKRYTSFNSSFKVTWDLFMTWSRVTHAGYFPPPVGAEYGSSSDPKVSPEAH